MRSTSVIPKYKIKTLLNLKGVFGNIISGLFMSLTGINKINRMCKPIETLKGVEFAEKALECAGVTVVVGEEDLAQIPSTGSFILCANHPFGSIDGLILLSRVCQIRPDLKILANFILSNIPVVSEYFLPVNPFTEGKKSSHKGIRMALEHIQNGGALAVFPSGEVSSNCNPQNVVKDVEWQKGIMKIIINSKVPVIPAYFDGENSRMFHFLGKIHQRLRTIRLPYEFTNKKGMNVTFKIGKAIPASEIKAYADPVALGTYLWNKTYALEAEMERSNDVKSNPKCEIIEQHVDSDILLKEREELSSSILYQENGYTCYLNRYEEIPNIIREIGISREETFRSVGEGTNSSIDLDEYDKYYYHMHLWKDEDNLLVGAYRIGFGDEIIQQYGIKGFYSNQFFRYDDGLKSILLQSIELGRSFIVPNEQRRPLSLNMLFKGLFHIIKKYNNVHYFFGPASITSAMPLLYRSLIVNYLLNSRGNPELSAMIHPICPFMSNYLRVESDKLVKKDDSIEQFDRMISRLSGGKYRIPTLVRKYTKLNGVFLAFNVDPDFNYSLDGVVLVKVKDIPQEEFQFLQKES